MMHAITKAATILLLAGTLAVPPSTAIAQEGSGSKEMAPQTTETLLESAISSGYRSRFLYRGMAFSEGPVVQHALDATYGPVGVEGFVNYDAMLSRVTEIDASVIFTQQVHQGVSAFAGFTYFHFPQPAYGKTRELMGGLSWENAIVTPRVLVAHDLDYGGTHAEFNLAKDISLGTCTGQTNVTLGFNQDYWNPGRGLGYVQADVGINLPVTPALTFSVSLTALKAIDASRFKDAMGFDATVSYTIAP